jgi:hypothetical protein
MKLHELDELIKTVCPISGISSEGVIWFLPDATQAEREAAQAIMDANIALVDDNAPEPVILTARQFLAGLVLAGFITEEEALDRSQLPAFIASVFNSLPPQQTTVARITWANMTVVSRDEPLVAAVAVALNQTPEQIDAFFAMASTL